MDAHSQPTLPHEITHLVFEIAAHQRALGLSDVAFVTRYPVLGSVRTWRTRLVGGAIDELRIEGWAPRLRGLVAAIEAEEKPAAPCVIDPIARIERHLDEGMRAHLEKDWALAAAHYRSARRAIEALEKEISDSIPF
jgi:hypothetical protein